MRIAVISDVHGNLEEMTIQMQIKYDKVIIDFGDRENGR